MDLNNRKMKNHSPSPNLRQFNNYNSKVKVNIKQTIAINEVNETGKRLLLHMYRVGELFLECLR